MQRRIGRKDLYHLVGKLLSMHLTVPGAVSKLYNIQSALTQGGEDRAWILTDLHQIIRDWKAPVTQTAAWPIHLTNIVRL